MACLAGGLSRQAMATLTTHDLATLSGFWQGADIDLAHRLGLYDDEQTWQRLLAERHQERQALLDVLRRADCLSANTPARAEEVAMSSTLNAAIHRLWRKAAARCWDYSPKTGWKWRRRSMCPVPPMPILTGGVN